MTIYDFEVWTGFKWWRVRPVAGIGNAIRLEGLWSALGFDVRVTCGGIVIDEQRGVIRKAA